jgi:hypothetical protein
VPHLRDATSQSLCRVDWLHHRYHTVPHVLHADVHQKLHGGLLAGYQHQKQQLPPYANTAGMPPWIQVHLGVR